MEETVKAIRIFKDEDTNQIFTPKISLPLEEIYYIEEYTGDAFPGHNEIIIVKLCSGESICLLGSFKELSDKIDNFRKKSKVFINN